MKLINIVFTVVLLLLMAACNSAPDTNISVIKSKLNIDPEYSGITVPFNIAPLNFLIEEEGESFFVKIVAENGTSISLSSKNGIITIPKKKWKKLLEQNKNGKIDYQVFIKREREWKKFETFTNKISGSAIDPFLYYRLLYPGYESWTEISIVQRNLENDPAAISYYAA